MDILEQFLNDISYKFPKGYPDIEDPKDREMLFSLLEEVLGEDPLSITNDIKESINELETPQHFDLRVEQRGRATDILNINQQMVGDRNVEEVKQQVMDELEAEFKKRALRLSKIQSLPISFTNTVLYKIIKPILLSDGVRHELIFKTQSTVGETDIETEYVGSYYYAIIDDDRLFTIKLGDKETDDELIKKTISHQEQKDRPIKPVKILEMDNFEYIISLDEVEPQETVLIDPNTLPYSVKTDYRKGTKFTHDDYGTGTIVATSSGNTGKGDQNGKLDWVEVDFGKEYVSKGVLYKTRKIKNVYTSLSPTIASN